MTSISDGRHTSTARGTTSASRIGGIVGTSGDGLGCEFPFQSRINSAQLVATGHIDCRRSALKFAGFAPSLLTAPAPFLVELGAPGSSRALLCAPGSSWARLDGPRVLFGAPQALLGSLGRLRALLGAAGLSWVLLMLLNAPERGRSMGF